MGGVEVVGVQGWVGRRGYISGWVRVIGVQGG